VLDRLGLQHRLDLGDATALDDALRGADALVIATGARPSVDLTGPLRVDAWGVQRQVQSCQRVGVRRVVLVSSLCAGRWAHPLNLFGLIPFDPTTLPLFGPFLSMGAWPLLMGVTMFLQQKLNPPPPDPVQAKLFQFMPIMFTFMLAGFPAGLVIYWSWNNLLSIAQQWLIMRQTSLDKPKNT